jgi:hypothetical protein
MAARQEPIHLIGQQQKCPVDSLYFVSARKCMGSSQYVVSVNASLIHAHVKHQCNSTTQCRFGLFVSNNEKIRKYRCLANK